MGHASNVEDSRNFSEGVLVVSAAYDVATRVLEHMKANRRTSVGADVALRLRGVTASIAALLLLASGGASAQESAPQTLLLATLETAPGLETHLACPAGVADAVTMFCIAEVKGSGKSPDVDCFGPNRDEDLKYSKLAAAGVRRTGFRPAKRDGKAIPVILSLRVIFDARGETCTVYSIPNLGVPVDTPANHIAPQEIMDDGGWFARTRVFRGGNVPWKRGYFNDQSGIAFWMSVAVSETGEASDVVLERNDNLTDQAAESVLKAFGQSQFIPGAIDGRPSPMRYHFVYVVRDMRATRTGGVIRVPER